MTAADTNGVVMSQTLADPGELDVVGPESAATSNALVVPVSRRRHARPLLVVAAVWLGLIVVVAISAPWLPIADPNEIGSAYDQAPSWWPLRLGTDDLGRSELSRIIWGARVSLFVGTGAAMLALVIGTFLGILAGYARGVVEYVVDVLTNSALAIPPLILLLALTSVFEPSAPSLMIALGFVAVPLFARVAKANTLVYAKRDWVLAARASGASPARVVLREVVPSVLLPVLSFAIVTAAALILAEGSLSYLGLGVRPPQPSWGAMIAAGQPYLETHPHEVFVPAAAFFLTVVSINLVGDWCRQRVATGAAR